MRNITKKEMIWPISFYIHYYQQMCDFNEYEECTEIKYSILV